MGGRAAGVGSVKTGNTFRLQWTEKSVQIKDKRLKIVVGIRALLIIYLWRRERLNN